MKTPDPKEGPAESVNFYAPFPAIHRAPAQTPATPLLVALAASMLATPAPAQVRCLSDEFDRPASIHLWQRVHEAEHYAADQLALWDLDASSPGRMVLMPHTSTWYRDYRGAMAFKEVSGDFVITVRVRATGRDGVSIPASSFSLGGIMLRTARDITPDTWQPGGENYVFLSAGYGSASPRRWQYEVKTTTNSDSNLILSDADGPDQLLQIARIGRHIIALRRSPSGSWQVHQRYARPDFPQTLQVGAVAYTDWDKVQHFTPVVHNRTVLNPPLPPGVVDPTPLVPYTPDLLAAYEYARFAAPQVPQDLVGADLSNPGVVPDARLLEFLGQAPDAAYYTADVNFDGQVDFFDYLDFAAAFDATSPDADFNRDEQTDFFDYLDFVAAYAEGC
jgi:hypothetical protein